MVSIKKFHQRGWFGSACANWRSLKFRLTLLTLTIFLLSVWSLAFYASSMLRADMEQVLGEQQFATVSLVAEQVDTELSDRLKTLQRIAEEIEPAMLDQPALLQTFLDQHLNYQNLFNDGISVTGADGTVIVDVPRAAARIGTNYGERDYIAAVMKEGKPMIGRPVIGKLRHSPVLVLAVPIRAGAVRARGVLFGVIRLDRPNFLDQIMASRSGKNGAYLLIAPQHKLFVTATDKSRIMQPIPAPGVNPLFDRYMQGYEGHGVSMSSRGIEELTATKSIPVAGWRIGLVIPSAEVFAPIRAMQQRMLLATIGLTLLTGSLTWCLISWMLRRQLSPALAAARTLADLPDINQPAPPLEVAREDEIGQLIGNFNRVLHTLNQREAFLKQVLDTSSVAIFLVDMEGRIKLANRRMGEMFQCSVADLQGKEYVALLSPAERESGRQNMLALLHSETERVDLDRLYWRPDNTGLWGHLTGKRFHDANGEERGLIGVITDITERKLAEEKLQLDASVFIHAHEGIMITSADGTIIDVNEACQRITGYGPQDILGKNPRILSSGRQSPEFYAGMWRDLAENGHWCGEVWNRNKSGGIYAALLTISAVRDARNNTRQYVALFSDVTERKQMEEQVRQLAFYDALTRLPNRRLLNDRLKQAMATSKRSGCHGALMVLDLDNFKSLNDTHGHLVGDLLLIEVANRLRACVRATDTVARFGGDEFVVVLSDLSADRTESAALAGAIAEEIRVALAAPYRLTVRDASQAETMVEHRCSASIGLVLFIDDKAGQDDILRCADGAMYQAKDAGHNLVRIYAQPAQE